MALDHVVGTVLGICRTLASYHDVGTVLGGYPQYLRAVYRDEGTVLGGSAQAGVPPEGGRGVGCVCLSVCPALLQHPYKRLPAGRV